MKWLLHLWSSQASQAELEGSGWHRIDVVIQNSCVEMEAGGVLQWQEVIWLQQTQSIFIKHHHGSY